MFFLDFYTLHKKCEEILLMKYKHMFYLQRLTLGVSTIR